MPAGYGRHSGTAPRGYGRGAAGNADTLLDLFEATCEERFLSAAQRAGAWLARLSQPVGDGSGLDWPEHEHEPLTGASWYRGAGGIARFFLHLATLDAAPGAAEIAARAAHTAARGARMSGPTQCHGLAGNIELLLDAFQATRETAYLTEARVLARLLGTFRIERRGGVAWPGEWPEQFTPDYLTGEGGVASCLLRLAEPEHRPHGLSRAGFRYRPRATSTPAPAGEEMAPI